jgi:hypothetical protein
VGLAWSVGQTGNTCHRLRIPIRHAPVSADEPSAAEQIGNVTGYLGQLSGLVIPPAPDDPGQPVGCCWVYPRSRTPTKGNVWPLA